MESYLVREQSGCLQSAGSAVNSKGMGSLQMNESPGRHWCRGSRLRREMAVTKTKETFKSSLQRNTQS